MTQQKTQKLTFREAYKELEALAREFEKENLDLEEAFKKYEHGLELAELCMKQLSGMKNKVQEIKKKFRLASDGQEEEV